MNNEEKYMQRCLDLAQKAIGYVAPNPLVGCVIVHHNKIIGEGYHQQFGEAHAEVNAINSVTNKELLKDAELYVNLEPCAHCGKTPPCTEPIIHYKIPKIIIGSLDPNPLVSGKGISQLKNIGCIVQSGVLEKECREINKRFITFHEKHRPYIILKWAETKDGFIDIERKSDAKVAPTPVMNEKLKPLVHRWRSEEQAIMIGTNTAIKDNPQLDVRFWKGKNPIRIVLDKNLRIPNNFHVLDQSIKTIVFTEEEKTSSENLEYISIDFSGQLIQQILQILYKKNIQSIIIEGGTQLLKSFIDQDLWDEASIITGNKYFEKGVKAPAFNSTPTNTEFFQDDSIKYFRHV
jgi:diaminohydroxyphosphoribosylaminopyrimidine deaminase / 5-amino-6-(5-phosphoribosylamino)uracil reductase